MKQQINQVVQIGLKEVNKADLEIKKSNSQEEAHHTIGRANYELLKARLLTDTLSYAMQEMEIPFAGPKNSVLDAILTKRFPSAEKVGETLKDLISQLTRLYHFGTVERAKYIAIAVEKIAKEHSLTQEQTADLAQSIEFIVGDGVKKTFRDNVGRQIPIPDASTMAASAEAATKLLKDTVSKGAPVVNVKSLISMLRKYAIIERRAHLATSEFDKRQIFDELTKLTEDIASDPALSLLIKNRMEYTINASSPMVRLSMARFTDLINVPVLKLDLMSIDTPIKIVKYGSPLLDANKNLDDLEYVSTSGLVNYVNEVMGAVVMQSSAGDVVSSIFSNDVIEQKNTSAAETDKLSEEIIRSLHDTLFTMEVIKLLGQSFSTIPSYNSVSLSAVIQSLSAKLDVYTLEPAIIALDSIKAAYFAAFKSTISLLGTGFYIPSDSEIESLKKRSAHQTVFKYLWSREHDELYIKTVDSILANAENRKKVLVSMPQLTNSNWRIGRPITKHAEGANIVMRSMLYTVETHLEETADVIMNDGTMSDEEIIGVLTGKYGNFRNMPYHLYRYSYGNSDIDTIFGHTTLEKFNEIQTAAAQVGALSDATGNVVLLDSVNSEPLTILRERLNISTDKFWAVKMPLHVIMVPSTKFALRYFDPMTKTSKQVTVNSPLVEISHTTVRTPDVKHSVQLFVQNGSVHTVMATSWPSVSTRTLSVADLTKNRTLASFMPSEAESQRIMRKITMTGTPTIEQVRNSDVNSSKLIDFDRLFNKPENENGNGQFNNKNNNNNQNNSDDNSNNNGGNSESDQNSGL